MSTRPPGSAAGVLEALLGGLFDYAGMFPPAALAFDAALCTGANFQATLARPWLVGSEAVLPADRLAALTPDFLAECGFEPGAAPRVVVLGPPALELASGMAVLGTAPAGAVRPRKSGAVFQLVSYEIKVPTLSPDMAPGLEALMHAAGAAGMRLYVEPEWTPADWLGGAREAAELLADLRTRARGPGIGLKVRGSGPAAIDRRALAAVIAAVNGHGLPLKATAGLHHPILEPDRYGNALGFLNLAAALRLQKILGPDRFGAAEVEACLGETDPAAFDLSAGLAWRGFAATLDQLAAAIRTVPFSIGSCSLHEPDADLRRLFPANGYPLD